MIAKSFLYLARAIVAASAGMIVASGAQAAGLDLSKYQVSIAQSALANGQGFNEGGALTYDWDGDRLLGIGDESGISYWDRNTDALARNTLGNAGWRLPNTYRQSDPEGVTYVGNGDYLLAEERTSRIVKIRIDPSKTDFPNGLRREAFSEPDPAFVYTVSGGPNWGNQGLEGISYDPITGGIFAVKETNAQRVMFVDWDFNTPNAPGTTVDLFDASVLGLQSLSDIATLSTVDAFDTADFRENLLILSQSSQLLLEVTRTGDIVSRFDLSNIFSSDENQRIRTIEGLTLDKDGNIFLMGELGGFPRGLGSSLIKLTRVQTAAVPEPATWAMMIGGFGLVGGAMRRRKTVVAFA